jgi:ABC-type branched-subunit amino acid transport system permease subunit
VAIGLFNERSGVDGRPGQAVTADSQSRTETAINGAERLLGEEQLEVITGICSSARTVPLASAFAACLPATAALAGALLGWPAFRLRVVGRCFAFVTLAAGGIVRILVTATRAVSGGSLGMTPNQTPPGATCSSCS